MKQNFDNAGFAQVQATVINLPEASLQQEVQQIRDNFVQWLNDSFELSESQLLQLNDLDPVFRQSLADATADSWAARNTILFYKEEDSSAETKRDKDKDKPLKDIILERGQVSSQSVQSPNVHTHETVSIQIVDH